MQFAILTTTHQRPTELLRAILSVQAQTYTKHTHYIVNDSPECDYAEVEKNIKEDPKIVYIKNAANLGKNTSLNILLEKLTREDFQGFVVYLDDDDWLAMDCLLDFKSVIEQNFKNSWFISNRSLESGQSLTLNKTKKSELSYFTDYLVLKRFSGDATHCIKFNEVKNAYFPTQIKNGEEWYYFLQVSKACGPFLYISKSGTYTDGYNTGGQNALMQENYLRNTFLLFREKQTRSIFSYLVMRTFYLLFKKIF